MNIGGGSGVCQKAILLRWSSRARLTCSKALLIDRSALNSIYKYYYSPIIRQAARMDNSLMGTLKFYAVDEDTSRKYIKLKIMLLGFKAVGKSTLLEVYTKKKKPNYQLGSSSYRGSQGTEGLDFVCEAQKVEGVDYKLHIWDTADFTVNRNLIPLSLYEGVMCFVVVYNITQRASFDGISQITNFINDKGEHQRDVFLVGTLFDKQDELKREVSLQQARIFASNRNIKLREVYLKNREDVAALFEDITKTIFDRNKAKDTIKLTSASRTEGFEKRYNKCF